MAFMFNVKQKGWANVGQKKSKKVLELVVVIDQEKDNANNQQMTWQNVGVQAMKFGKVQTRIHVMVELFNNNETLLCIIAWKTRCSWAATYCGTHKRCTKKWCNT